MMVLRNSLGSGSQQGVWTCKDLKLLLSLSVYLLNMLNENCNDFLHSFSCVHTGLFPSL